MGLFNYLFDQYFKATVCLNPYLSFLYVFQYHLILPLINFAFLSVLFYVGNIEKNLRTHTHKTLRSWSKLTMRPLASLVLVLLVSLSFSTPVWAKPRSGQAGDSDVAHALLVTKTAEWESIWPGAFGKVKYQVEGDMFVGLITIHGLKPETEYVLTVNGPGGTDTDVLIASAALADSGYPSLYDGWWVGEDGELGTEDDEGYYDFASVTSNEGGNLEYKFSVALPAGTYLWVKFLVKDTTLGWETILMEDAALSFTIAD